MSFLQWWPNSYIWIYEPYEYSKWFYGYLVRSWHSKYKYPCDGRL